MDSIKKIFIATLSLLFVSSNFVSAEESQGSTRMQLSEETGVSVQELEKRWAEYEENGFDLTKSESDELFIGSMGALQTDLNPGNMHGYGYFVKWETKARRDFWWNNNWTSSAVAESFDSANYPNLTYKSIGVIEASVKIYGPRQGTGAYQVTASESDTNTNYYKASAIAKGNSGSNGYTVGSYRFDDSSFGTAWSFTTEAVSYTHLTLPTKLL